MKNICSVLMFLLLASCGPMEYEEAKTRLNGLIIADDEIKTVIGGYSGWSEEQQIEFTEKIVFENQYPLMPYIFANGRFAFNNHNVFRQILKPLVLIAIEAEYDLDEWNAFFANLVEQDIRIKGKFYVQNMYELIIKNAHVTALTGFINNDTLYTLTAEYRGRFLRQSGDKSEILLCFHENRPDFFWSLVKDMLHSKSSNRNELRQLIQTPEVLSYMLNDDYLRTYVFLSGIYNPSVNEVEGVSPGAQAIIEYGLLSGDSSILDTYSRDEIEGAIVDTAYGDLFSFFIEYYGDQWLDVFRAKCFGSRLYMRSLVLLALESEMPLPLFTLFTELPRHLLDKVGSEILNYAIFYNQLNLIDVLYSKKSHIGEYHHRRIPLVTAAEAGDLEAVLRLLLYSQNAYTRDAYQAASDNGHFLIADLLKQHIYSGYEEFGY